MNIYAETRLCGRERDDGMTEAEFRKELKSGLSGAYLFYGGEEYLKRFYSGRAERLTIGDDAEFSDWNKHVIDAKRDSLEFAALNDALMQIPMMADKVFVRYNADLTVFTEAEIEKLCEIVATIIPEQTTLLIVTPEDGFDVGNLKKDKPSAMYKALSEVATLVDIPVQTPAELKKWMERRLSKDLIRILPDAEDLLLEKSGKTMFMLAGELDKLSAYALANNENIISAPMVEEIAATNEEDEAFALANAILDGDRRRALKVLNLSKKMQMKPPAVLAGVIRSICEMTEVSCIISEGGTAETVAAKMKMHPYRASLYVKAVKELSPERLFAAANRCREADLKLKTTKLDYIALERLICTIPAKRRTAR